MSLSLHERGMRENQIVTAILTAIASRVVNGTGDPFTNYRQIRERMTAAGIQPDYIPSLGSISQNLDIGLYATEGTTRPQTDKTYHMASHAQDALNLIQTTIQDRIMLVLSDIWIDGTTTFMNASSEAYHRSQAIDTTVKQEGPKLQPAISNVWPAMDSLSDVQHRLVKVREIVYDSSLPKIKTKPRTVKSSPIPPTPAIDAMLASEGIPPMNQSTTTSTDAETQMLQQALATITKVPKLTAAIENLTAKNKELEEQAGRFHRESMTAQATVGKQAEEIKRQQDVIEELNSRSTAAVTAPCAVTLPGGKRNDLDRLSQALRIARTKLDQELQEFAEACATPLANPARWAAWCNPNNLDSPLPFHYRHNEPVFLAGESGTGKTFLAEALCQHIAGRRCCVTFHEKLSYAKLFIRETVDGGQVRGVLGPVLMSLLTATPFIADEIDHADVFVQSLLHELLDKKRVFIPELALTLHAEDGFRVIATGNSLCDDSGQYHGEVGTALKTRFAGIHVKYPDPKEEARTVQTASNCGQDTSETIAKVFAALRGAVNEQKLAGPISVRESCAVGRRMVMAESDGLNKQAAWKLAFSGACVEKRPVNEQQVAAEIIANLTGVPVTEFLAGIK